MVLHHNDTEPSAPNTEHGPVHNICEGTLRIISVSLPLCRWIITSAKEPPLSSSKRDKIPDATECIVSPFNSFLMSGKCSKVLWLKPNDDWLGEVGLHGEGFWLSTVIRTMPELFAHVTIRVVSVERPLSDCLICSKIACPRKLGPADSSHSGVHISRFNS